MRCYEHETVMFPPKDCLQCIRHTYGWDSEEYKEARQRVVEREARKKAREARKKEIEGRKK
jgi:hypothetical protein